MKSRLLARGGGYAALFALVTVAAIAHSADEAGLQPSAAMFYKVKNLTSDGTSTRHTDPNLVNGWGLVAGPTTPWWVANNGTNTSTLYRASGRPLALVVDVPGAPTGIVYNGGTQFVLTKGRRSKPALFMFAGMDGKITAWNTLDSSQAVVVVDNSLGGAVYTGLAIAETGGGAAAFLYAADFRWGRVDVFDGEFHPAGAPGAFVDPTLPAGYAPFGIQNIGGQIYVAYALRDDTTGDEVAGPGLGYVSAFDTAGVFLGRIASQGDLNAPWGLAMAPADFGPLSGHLLVGNFGDGKINAFEAAAPHTAKGPLKDKAGQPIVIDGLWGIAFGNGAAAGPTNVLYFAAGPDDETHGLFGSVKVGRSFY
jgi:uncharacterized protein (TIGR03118 family)